MPDSLAPTTNPTLPERRRPRWMTCPARASARSRRHAAVNAAATLMVAGIFDLDCASPKLLRVEGVRRPGQPVRWMPDVKFPRKQHRQLAPDVQLVLAVCGKAAVLVWDAKLRGARPDWEWETSDAARWPGIDPSLLPTVAQRCKAIERFLNTPQPDCWATLVWMSRRLIEIAR